MVKWTLPAKLHRLIYKKERDKALGFLSKITAINQPSLFGEDDESYLRYAGYFRIQILLEWGYYREALAWVCLECELYPDNISSIALKEKIKKRIVNLPKTEADKFDAEFSTGWNGIAGMREVKAAVERDIILPLTQKELYKKYRVQMPNGYLFYGPPGCGKTFFASKLADRIGFNFIKVSPSDIGSTYVHGTQLELRRVFDDARDKAPCLLFFDEFESIAPRRNSGDVSFHYKSEVNELLNQLNKVSDHGILFIAATNYIRNIDDAILRPGRIDKKIFIGPPDFEARIESFKLQLLDRPVGKIVYDYIAEMTEYFTHADIEEICNEVARIAIFKRSPITTDLLGSVISNFKPQLTEEKIQEYFQ